MSLLLKIRSPAGPEPGAHQAIIIDTGAINRHCEPTGAKTLGADRLPQIGNQVIYLTMVKIPVQAQIHPLERASHSLQI